MVKKTKKQNGGSNVPKGAMGEPPKKPSRWIKVKHSLRSIVNYGKKQGTYMSVENMTKKVPKDAGYMSAKNPEDAGYMTSEKIQGANYMVADPSKSSYMTAYEAAKKPTNSVYINVAAANPPKTSHYVNISPYPNTTKKAYDFLTQKAKQGAVLSTRLARINPEYLSKLDKDKRLPYLYKLYAQENAQIIDNMLKTEIDNLKTNTDKAIKLSKILTDFKNRALENNKKRTNIVENITLFMNKHTNPNVKQKVRTKERSKTILENAIKKVKEQSIYSTLASNRIGINPFIPSSTGYSVLTQRKPEPVYAKAQ